MTLLIDPPNAPGHGRMWSHLASDTSYEELHAFAGRLGIPERGFDRDHYDVPADRYDQVVAAGALPVSSRELVSRLTDAGLRRRKGTAPTPRRRNRPLLRPHRLHPGDRVAVVAPAGPAPPDQLDAGMDVLRSWGLDPVEAPHLRGTAGGLGYLAAPDRDRAEDLMAAWTDSQVTAVFCARGGYGAQRVLDLLDWDALAAAGPKPLVGFSDITALHQAWATRLGAVTIHGPVVTSLGRPGGEPSREHLRSLLFDEHGVDSITPTPATTLVPGRAEGVLVGGTAALLASAVGTGSHLPAAGGIAVLEDVGEEPYRLDRLLTQLLRAGWFGGVRGVVLGEFTGSGDPATLRALLEDRLVPLGVPTIADVPVGHGRQNLAFPLGVTATLDADLGTLTWRRPALL